MQQKKSADDTTEWGLLGEEHSGYKKAEEVFKLILEKTLKLKLKPSSIRPVYDYFHEGMGKDNFVFYVKCTKLEDFSKLNGHIFSWFTFKEISKLKLNQKAKQDITIGQRVINSYIRKKKGEKTIE